MCKILNNPCILEQDNDSSSQQTEVEANVDALIGQRHKLQKGMDRLINSFAEGVIDKLGTGGTSHTEKEHPGETVV